MTYTSYPFDNQDTSENQYSALFRELQDSGVVDVVGGSGLNVTANASAMSVTLAPGSAVVRGHFFNNDATATLTIGAAGGAVRYDAVILRLDPNSNSIVPFVVANAGVAPVLTQTATGVYEILLAVVTVNTSATTIAAANVADKRQYIGARVRISPSTNRPTDARNYSLNIATDKGGRIEVKDPTLGWVTRIPMYWGTGTVYPTAGVIPGDTYTHTGLQSLMRYNGAAWRQVEPAELANTTARDAIPASYSALMYVGFKVYTSDFAITWQWNGTMFNAIEGYTERLALVAGWTHFRDSGGGNWSRLQVTRYGNIVSLQGLIANTNAYSTPTLFAGLPARYRPAVDVMAFGYIGQTIFRFDIASSGDMGVVPWSTIAANNYHSFSTTFSINNSN